MYHLLRLITIGLLWPCLSFAQSDLDVGLFLGLSSHGSDLNSWSRHGQGMFDNTDLAYGFHIRYGVKEKVNLKLQFRSSQFNGDDANLANKEMWGANHVRRGYTYRTSISEVGLILEYELLKKQKSTVSNQSLMASENLSPTYIKRKFSPYLFGGFAIAFLSDDENERSWGNIPDGKEQDVLLDQMQGSVGGFQVPLGIGVKYNFNSNIYADLFYSARLPVSDYLDGISESANPEANDSYQFCGINLGFYLNGDRTDSDGDGVTDKNDECPTEPGVKTLFGCPDADLDGIMDKHDNCPDHPGPAKTFGCPDSDEDGVIDSLDKCPNQFGSKENRGCPKEIKIPD